MRGRLFAAFVGIIAGTASGCDGACHVGDVDFVVGPDACDDPFGCTIDFGVIAVGASASQRLSWSSTCAQVDAPNFFDESGVFSLDELVRDDASGFAFLSARPTSPELHIAAFTFPLAETVTFRLRAQGE